MASLPSTITIPVKRDAARHHLLVFHHACGAATSYHRWALGFPADIEVWLIELPGRGRNLQTPALATLPEVLTHLRELQPLLPRDYAVFGHSMGALVGYCFACDMTQLGHPPVWLGASAAEAPFYPHRHARRTGAPVHLRSDEGIIDYMVSLGGTPREVAEHAELKAMLLDMARADFHLVEACFPLPAATALPLPVTVFSGRDDPVASPAGLQDWARASRQPVTFHDFDGGHFYLMLRPAAVRDAIVRALNDARAPRAASRALPSLP
ncbi:thioesterase II family protein [Burkholderia alba]|uniref:thioesterase II family protein n=1 Tax=Burkholderia alba TaxID=2683677 RepID=UPI002B05F252|nr:alpha/beta fold hydrolase [Burkholderia alba]